MLAVPPDRADRRLKTFGSQEGRHVLQASITAGLSLQAQQVVEADCTNADPLDYRLDAAWDHRRGPAELCGEIAAA